MVSHSRRKSMDFLRSLTTRDYTIIAVSFVLGAIIF